MRAGGEIGENFLLAKFSAVWYLCHIIIPGHQYTALSTPFHLLFFPLPLSLPLLLTSFFSPLQLYGAATMNNTLALGVFAALVYVRDLDWQFSAGELSMGSTSVIL